MKKILGVIVYSMGFLGVAYIITETNIDFGDGFIGILGVFVWLFLTMGIGTVLIKSEDNTNSDNK